MATFLSSPPPGTRVHQIDISKLTLHQLSQLKQQVDQELQVFQSSLQTLKMAQGKYVESRDNVAKITADSAGKEILVPLTGSMYVPGTLADTEHVIIDVGTGYYIQKTVEGGKDYFERRVKFVTEQMEKIQLMGVEKSKIREAVCSIIETKFQAQAQKPQTAS